MRAHADCKKRFCVGCIVITHKKGEFMDVVQISRQDTELEDVY